MSVFKSKGFKYFKNLVIGLGAAIVMLGALFKIQSWEGGEIMLTIGLCTEAVLFFILGVLPPEKDYYWEKLYPGLDVYNSNIQSLTAGEVGKGAKPLDGEKIENRLGGMLSELQSMSKSLGSLKALQDVDFSKTGEQIKVMGSFYDNMNVAMKQMAESIEDTKEYKSQVQTLNKNLGALNNVYGNVLTAFNPGGSK